MTTSTPPKIGVVSHVLPPSPSGQAMVLYRLLAETPPERYSLISMEDYGGGEDVSSASGKLSGMYHRLLPPFVIRSSGIPGVSGAVDSLNAKIAVRSRARQIAEIARRERCGVLVGCTGNLYDLPATALAARWAGVPFVPYIFDDYINQWTGTSRRIAARLEPAALRAVRAVIVPNEHTQTEYERRCGVRGTIVRNPCPMPDLAALGPGRARCSPPVESTSSTPGPSTTPTTTRSATSSPRSGSSVERRDPAPLHGPDRGGVGRTGIAGPMVVHHPHIPPAEVPAVLRQADILFLPAGFRLADPRGDPDVGAREDGGVPVRRRPILVHAPGDSFVSWYFRENRCGIVVDRKTRTCSPLRSAGSSRTEIFVQDWAARARAAAERDFEVGAVRNPFHGGAEGLRRGRGDHDANSHSSPWRTASTRPAGSTNSPTRDGTCTSFRAQTPGSKSTRL